MPVLLTMLLALSSVAFAQTKSIKAIYGEDNRHEVYSYGKPEISKLAKSTVALIREKNYEEVEQLLNIKSPTFENYYGLCSDERFKDQPTAAFCSGFLISPTKIVTAGHCISSDVECANIRFVFDYVMTDESTATSTFNQDQVYSCSRILGRKKVQGDIDFAIVELTRPVSDRTPLKLSNNKSLKNSDKLFVIGHPSGLPAKITDNARVIDYRPGSNYFMTNADTYGGNSGSAVFNEKTLEVEGILVRGNTDFHSSSSCRSSSYYPEDTGEEAATLISKIEENFSQSNGTQLSSEYRYVWISFKGCVEMYNNAYNRVVDAKYCPDAPAIQYSWNENNTVCRELRGSIIMREVETSKCPALAPLRYVWKDFHLRCAEYRGEQFIRYTERRYCR